MSTGRPTKYTIELADIVLERIAAGESVRAIGEDADMPAACTMFRWLGAHEEFRELYTRAKEESAHSDADRVEEIAERVIAGTLEPGAGRVAMFGYMWTAGKKKPRKYGDIKNINVKADLRLTDLSDEELARRLNQLEQAADD